MKKVVIKVKCNRIRMSARWCAVCHQMLIEGEFVCNSCGYINS